MAKFSICEMNKKIREVLDKKISSMTDDEFNIWRDYVSDDELRELNQIEAEFDKLNKMIDKKDAELKEKSLRVLSLENNQKKDFIE